MERLSRRAFSVRLAASTLLPLAASARPLQDTAAQEQRVAGYLPDAGERGAMEKFLADLEKALTPLRSMSLPNDLPPAVIFHPAGRPGHD